MFSIGFETCDCIQIKNCEHCLCVSDARMILRIVCKPEIRYCHLSISDTKRHFPLSMENGRRRRIRQHLNNYIFAILKYITSIMLEMKYYHLDLY